MLVTDILAASDISNAIKECQALESFDFKKFFQTSGLSRKSADEIKNVFLAMDDDDSGYIELDELKFFLQRFSPIARVLTEAETEAFLKAADTDGDERIGTQEFVTLVMS
ncbi:parvalbumin, thymic [Callorhinchus milii]|uniref:Parvalbumin n=1 Tax=Callorhinchus milii TaxID=7868 RepID=V9LGB2_CALMI|nr:parvalbumin, thymic [Callorhinchus milii]|eukprot:gi/632952269/ref/XP_007891758.1/ PREDICTED: parvalbumin, thymic-like [Callorhinchus milii]